MFVEALKNFDFSPDGIRITPLKKGDKVSVKDINSVKPLITAGYFGQVKEQKEVKAVNTKPQNKMEKGPSSNKKEEEKKKNWINRKTNIR